MSESSEVIRSAPFARLKAGHLLCAVTEVTDPGGKEFVFEGKEDVVSIFVVRRGDLIRAYVNSCPHVGAKLNGAQNDFLSKDASRIVCCRHGAEFTLEEGICTGGPCVNYGLQQVPIRIVSGDIYTAEIAELHAV